MGAGSSKSRSESIVRVNETISQQFAGVCDFQCQNSLQNVNIDIINTRLSGGIDISQVCSVDGTCSIDSSMEGTTNIIAKGSASTNAKNASSILGIDFDDAESISKIDLNSLIEQRVFEKCAVSSVNEARNINIFAANSNITGGIGISQKGNVKGDCAFTNAMVALENATATSSATATSGKDKKGQKCGSCSGAEVAFTYIGLGILAIVALVILAGVIKSFTGKDSKGKSSSGLSRTTLGTKI